MKKNIAVAAALVAVGFAFGVGLKLLAWIMFVVVVASVVAYALTRGGAMGEDDIEEVFPEPPPVRSLDDRHQWRGNSPKAHHAD